MLPRLRQSVTVERGPEFVPRGRPVEVVAHVVLSGPDDFDRPGDLAGELGRFLNEVAFGSASETTTDERDVELGMFNRYTGSFCRDLTRATSDNSGAVRELRRGPDGALTVAHPGRTVHRLHGCMREVGEPVCRRDRLWGSVQGRGGVSFLRDAPTGLLRRFPQRLVDLRVVQGGAGSLIPLYDEGVSARVGLHVASSNDRDSAPDFDDLIYTGNSQSGCRIERTQAAAEYG